MELYAHSSPRLHGVVFNKLRTGTTLPFLEVQLLVVIRAALQPSSDQLTRQNEVEIELLQEYKLL
jgi:hypothetical protein